MTVSRTAIKEFLKRDFDDYTWMKRLSLSDIDKALSGLKVKPRFKTDPWLHQKVCFYIGLCCPQFLFLLDMGLGKTKILADLMTQLMREKRVGRSLVTVPRLINIDSWTDDLAVHSELEPWAVNCSDIEEKRERLLHPEGDVTLIDYQGLHWALCDRKTNKKTGKFTLVRNDKLIKKAASIYDFMGIDESHKLSSHDNLWFFIMKNLAKNMPHVYGSTGTLFGSDVTALWSQFRIIDGGETFGENLGIFQESFFKTQPNPWKFGGQEYVYDKKMTSTLNRMLQHRSIRYDETEVLDLPKKVPRRRIVQLSSEQREHYLRALEGLINVGGKLNELEAQWLRMRQIISGYLAWKDGNGSHVIRFKHNPKLDWLESKIDEMGDSKIIVCYDYTETGSMIVDRIKAMKLGHEWYYGGTKDKSASRRRFLADPACRVFVMNSEAGGTGNDGLQKVARYMVFYETPCSPTTRKQTEKRIHRPGQQERSFIWDIVADNSLDQGILDQIAEGVDVHDKVVNGRPPAKKFFLASAKRG